MNAFEKPRFVKFGRQKGTSWNSPMYSYHVHEMRKHACSKARAFQRISSRYPNTSHYVLGLHMVNFVVLESFNSDITSYRIAFPTIVSFITQLRNSWGEWIYKIFLFFRLICISTPVLANRRKPHSSSW